MIRYQEFPALLAHLLLPPAALAGGLFTAVCAVALSRLCARFGSGALFLAPALWAACEWARLCVIGQLWNAVGYSQAFQPSLIQAARFGGVYAIGFLVMAVNAALAYALLKRSSRQTVAALAVVACVFLVIIAAGFTPTPRTNDGPSAVVVAVQPNVIPDFKRNATEYAALTRRHFELSAAALRAFDESGAVGDAFASVLSERAGASVTDDGAGGDVGRAITDSRVNTSTLPRVVVWPESPMNFSFERNSYFRGELVRFVREHHASILFNSLEPTGDDGGYNAAVLVNEEGRVAAQYDKIRLMPFGEYVPLPRWLPGADSVRGVVGDFTPGER